MKKKLLITILVLLLAGVATAFTYSKKEGGDIPTDGEQMRVLNFNGHRYICYRWYEKEYVRGGAAGYGGASIVHDPDCPCGKH